MSARKEPEDQKSFGEAYRLMWGSEPPAAATIEPLLAIGAAGDLLLDSDLEPDAEVMIDLRDDAALEPTRSAPLQPSHADGMLVPLDAWQATLEQLGHLHESGQALALAMERAAKAETKSEFLVQRLAEARAERDKLKKLLEEFMAISHNSAAGAEDYREGSMVDLMADMAAEREAVRKQLEVLAARVIPERQAPAAPSAPEPKKRRWFGRD